MRFPGRCGGLEEVHPRDFKRVGEAHQGPDREAHPATLHPTPDELVKHRRGRGSRPSGGLQSREAHPVFPCTCSQPLTLTEA